MSTQVLENQTEKVTELNAAAVKNALSASPQTATRDYPITVTIFERFGRAFIAWSLHPNYAIGPEDVIQLREGNTFKGNQRVSGTSGEWDTGHGSGSGLNASYWAWNYVTGSAGWREMVVTKNT